MELFLPRPAHARLRAGLFAVAAASALVLSGAPFATAAPPDRAPAPSAAKPTSAGRYVVTLAAKPIAAYTGGVSGIPATRPKDGRRVDVRTDAATRYRSYLQRDQASVAARVGAKVQQSYSVSLNGFVADLTAEQAATLQKTAGVLGVTKDELRKPLNDSNGVDFLDLSGKKGVWKSLGGTKKAGAGVVVGVIDTGVWPEAKSFSGPALGSAGPTSGDPYRPYRVGDQVRMVKSDGSVFVGTCQTGQQFTVDACNTKLISARYFGKGWLADNTPGTDEYLSPRDGDEHGTHTASTAAGNADVDAVIGGRSYGKVSGVAPAAKVAVYKALWTGKTEDEDGGYVSDLAQAIDQAVADGVDVINYSVGSSVESDLLDPVQVAFLYAAAAGVFVSASAGNSGPGAATMDNTSPWVTTVAASSIETRYGTVSLGNGERYPGATNTVDGPVGPAPLVAAVNVKTGSATEALAAQCTAGTLDPAQVAGKVVACDRGGNARVDKSAEVQRAGGVGMVLLNLTPNSLDGDLHVVPTIIVNPPASAAIKEYAGTPGATVTLTKGNSSKTTIPYPTVAGFSSRGPSNVNPDLVKPDIAAPGVDILAASAPNTANHQVAFNFLSGTSMAAPHVAGLAALYFGEHPRYSPMEVKSALMTTAAATVDGDGKKINDAFAQGAGNVVPTKMFKPGVVLDSSAEDWWAYVEGQGIDTDSGVAPIDPSDYNAPSIGVGELVGRQTVTREVTAVRSGTYRVKAKVPGFTTKVSPSKLSFKRAGQTKSLEVTFTRTSAALDEAAFGSVTLKSSKASAHLPVALTPVAVSAPAAATGTGTSGSTTVDVSVGGAGTFKVSAAGLVPAVTDQGAVHKGGPSAEYAITVPEGSPLARFTVDSVSEKSDVDLEVYRVVDGKSVLVGQSGSATGDEEVTLTSPEAGSYRMVVVPFTDPDGTSSAFTASRWAVGGATSNLSVAPAGATVTAGQRLTLTAAWTGLTAGGSYLGWIGYPGGSGTVVSVTS